MSHETEQGVSLNNILLEIHRHQAGINKQVEFLESSIKMAAEELMKKENEILTLKAQLEVAKKEMA